jgi:hypothetical protein
MPSVADSNLRAAVKADMLRITIANGYRNTLLSVFDPPRNVQEITDFPAINLLWGGDERVNNGEYGGKIVGNHAPLEQHWALEADVFVVNQADPQAAADSIKADIIEYFHKNYWVPNTAGDSTAFLIIYKSRSAVGGTELERPNAWFTLTFDIYYRTPFDNLSVLM